MVNVSQYGKHGAKILTLWFWGRCCLSISDFLHGPRSPRWWRHFPRPLLPTTCVLCRTQTGRTACTQKKIVFHQREKSKFISAFVSVWNCRLYGSSCFITLPEIVKSTYKGDSLESTVQTVVKELASLKWEWSQFSVLWSSLSRPHKCIIFYFNISNLKLLLYITIKIRLHTNVKSNVWRAVKTAHTRWQSVFCFHVVFLPP